jgi:hypothetical protein
MDRCHPEMRGFHLPLRVPECLATGSFFVRRERTADSPLVSVIDAAASDPLPDRGDLPQAIG